MEDPNIIIKLKKCLECGCYELVSWFDGRGEYHCFCFNCTDLSNLKRKEKPTVTQQPQGEICDSIEENFVCCYCIHGEKLQTKAPCKNCVSCSKFKGRKLSPVR